MLYLAIALLLTAPLAAQFRDSRTLADGSIQHLSATIDGSVLYFSTALPLRTSGAPHQGRIYRWDASRGVQLVAGRDKTAGAMLSNYYDLFDATVDNSGDLLAFTARRDCRVGTFCVVTAQTAGLVQRTDGGEPLLQHEGAIHLSRNGRYALLSGFMSFGEVRLIDLATGVRRDSPPSSLVAGMRNRLADDGSHLQLSFGSPTNLVLQTADAGRVLPASATAWTAALSANGATVVYESQPAPGLSRRVYSIDIATGRETLLLSSEEVARSRASISISNDGRRILLTASEAADRVTQWLFLVNADGSRGEWLVYLDEGFREAILSGDGRVIFAVSYNNRLFRIDTVSGIADEIIPRTPFIALLGGTPLPGSMVRLQGGGFTWSECRADTYPLPESLCRIEVEFFGQRMPIERITPSEIRVQIPWDAPLPPPVVSVLEILPNDPITVHRSGSTPFAPPVYYRRRYIYPPEVEPDGVRHADGSPVTQTARARRGATIKVHATGLGPVDPPATTGQPARENVHYATSPIDCAVTVDSGLVAVELLLAVLAPGRVGVYELTVRLPAQLPNFSTTLNCRVHDGGGASRLLQTLIPLEVPER